MLRAIIATAVAALAASDPLFDALSRTIFLSSGTVTSSDKFVSSIIPVSYNEPENVSCHTCGWAVGGSMPFLFQANTSAPAPAQSCNLSSVVQGFDMPGMDIGAFPLTSDNITACQAACCANADCGAYLYEPQVDISFGSCTKGLPCCFLKSAFPGYKPKTVPGGIFAGNATKPAPAALLTPPIGMRSAVQLGGLGAGSVELRADGTFHEWTLHNQHPASGAKYPVLADTFTAVRLAPASGGAGVTRVLQTGGAAPPYATGVDQLSYSGSYPVSRLIATDDAFPSGVDVSLFAYSKLKMGDPTASAHPAIVLTLALSNPTDEAFVASFMFALPFASINDCARPSNATYQVLNGISDPVQCMHACTNASGSCSSWTHYATNQSCALAPDVPLNFWSLGATCGVAGAWFTDEASQGALSLIMRPPNAGLNPAVGDITLRGVNDAASGAVGSSSFGDDIASLYSQFAANGNLQPPSTLPTPSRVGAAAATATLAPRSNLTLSIVFAWYFPYKDFIGAQIGNYYATLWDSSAFVARELADTAVLTSAVTDIVTHHRTFAGPDISYPVWLQDAILNMFSHFHMLIWTQDGRMREFEAYSCDDVDSIHNDHQRSRIYLWAMSEFEKQKLVKWGVAGQASDGHIQEYLGAFGLSPFDTPGGRVMGDTTTLWLLELFETYSNSGDLSLVLQLWPNAVRAVEWMLHNANASGLPSYLVTTYDHFGFETYNAVTFNAFVYLTSLKAVQELAAAVGDTATGAAAASGYARASEALLPWMWNSTLGYFKAYTDGPNAQKQYNVLMADALYGQMLGLHHFGGDGWHTEQSIVAQHLAAEVTYNFDQAGFKVLMDMDTHTTIEPSVWLGAGPTWSYLQLKLGNMSVDDALEGVRRTIETERTALADLWNLRALLQDDQVAPPGAAPSMVNLPREQGHYAFLLPVYYLLPALSGQLNALHKGVLSFAPLYPCPYTLPWMMMDTTGLLTCAPASSAAGVSSVTYTLSVSFGAVSVPAGGLSVSGSAYPQAVDISAGESVSWTA
jgi:hypothetical protein